MFVKKYFFGKYNEYKPIGKIITLGILFCLLTIHFFILLNPPTVADLVFTSTQEPEESSMPLGYPRPDEVDLYGYNVWKTNANVPAHNNLGFRITSTATLTIYPGISIKFDSGTQILVEGKLYIMGIQAAPVVLTSNEGTPSMNDWSGIRFVSGSSGFVNHTEISYAINGVNLLNVPNIIVTNCSISETSIGIKIEDSADNNQVDNNEIYKCTNGIAIYNSSQNLIEKNEVHNSTFIALSLSDKADNNTIFNNNLSSSGNRAISLSGNANNNTFNSNNIFSNSGEGIRLTGTPDNLFNENNIYLNKIGILFYSGSDRNILIKNTFRQNSESAISFEGARNCEIINNIFLKNYYGIYSSRSSDIKIENSSFSESELADFDLNEKSIIDLINCTFKKSMVSIHDSAILNVYYYLILEILDETGSHKRGKIRIENAKDEILLPYTWIDSGIYWAKCLGYTQDQSGKDKSMNPYWFTASNGTTKFRYGIDMDDQSKVVQIKFVELPNIIEFSEDTKYNMKLSKYFNTFEGMDFKIEILSGKNISYAFNKETLELIATPPDNWNGEEEIRISATPKLGDTVHKSLLFKVTYVNDPPEIIDPIPNQLKREGVPSWDLDLSKYGYDLDLEYGDKLYWSISDVNQSLLNISIINNTQIMKFNLVDRDIFGNDKVTIWLEDKKGEKVWQEIWVNITSENDDPSLTNLLVDPKTGSPTTTFNFTVQYSDVDGNFPDYILLKLNNETSYQMKESYTNDQVVTDGKEYFYETKLANKAHFFVIECHDGFGGYTTSDRIYGPIVSMPDKGSLKGTVKDQDTKKVIPNAKITVKDLVNTSNKYEIKTDSFGNYSVVNLYPGQNRYQIYATALGYKDSEIVNRSILKGGTSILDFELEKLPGEIVDTNITAVWINANRTNITIHHAIKFSGSAEDLDGDILIFHWDFGDGTAVIQGKNVIHSFHKTGMFNVTLTVEDTDGNYRAIDINITVTPDPGADSTDDDKDDTSATNWVNKNSTMLTIILVLIFIIILISIFYIRMEREKAEDDLKIEEEEKRRRDTARERRRRKREMDFVDKEKRNVEQVNILISDLHRKRTGKSTGRKDRGYEKKDRRGRTSREKRKERRKGMKKKEKEIKEADLEIAWENPEPEKTTTQKRIPKEKSKKSTKILQKSLKRTKK